jgi:hypothetical protein
MNLDKMLFEVKNGQRRLKPGVVIGLSAALFALFALTVFMMARQNRPKQVDSPFAHHPSLSRQKLDYNIVQLDTISLGDYLKNQEPAINMPAPSREESTDKREPRTAVTASSRRVPESAAEYPASPRLANGSTSSVGDGNPNMIVYSSMGATKQAAGGGVLGRQSALVKVTLVDKISVTNNSLVEARVINEADLGGTPIPRRARLSGTASLQGSRVYIEFREIRIDGTARSCSGRAYDMKKQLGLPYPAVQAAQASAGKAVVDELKSAASGIPVVGRYAHQTNTNSLTEDVARFDEGYEFYVQLNSIY